MENELGTRGRAGRKGWRCIQLPKGEMMVAWLWLQKEIEESKEYLREELR